MHDSAHSGWIYALFGFPRVPADFQTTNLGFVKWFSICVLLDPSEPPPPPSCHPCLRACGVKLLFEFQSAQGTLLFIGRGGWASQGVSRSDWLRVSIKYSAWPTRTPPVALRRHKALTAAHGANPALHSSHVAFPPFIIRLMRRTQAAQSISALPVSFYRPPPSSSFSGQPLPPFHLSTLRLM